MGLGIRAEMREFGAKIAKIEKWANEVVAVRVQRATQLAEATQLVQTALVRILEIDEKEIQEVIEQILGERQVRLEEKAEGEIQEAVGTGKLVRAEQVRDTSFLVVRETRDGKAAVGTGRVQFHLESLRAGKPEVAEKLLGLKVGDSIEMDGSRIDVLAIYEQGEERVSEDQPEESTQEDGQGGDGQ